MKLTHLANSKIVITRLMPISAGSNKLAMSTVTGALVHLQPASPEKTQAIGGVSGKTYRIFTDFDTDLMEGDKLRDEDGNIYEVRKGGVTRWRHGAMDFQEAFITQQ
jgi:hypothetical protein